MALEQVTLGKTNDGEVSWPKFIGEKVVMAAILMFVISCVQQVSSAKRLPVVVYVSNWCTLVRTTKAEDHRRCEDRKAKQVGINRARSILSTRLNSYFNKKIRSFVPWLNVYSPLSHTSLLNVHKMRG